jgi:hypothetical protein
LVVAPEFPRRVRRIRSLMCNSRTLSWPPSGASWFGHSTTASGNSCPTPSGGTCSINSRSYGAWTDCELSPPRGRNLKAARAFSPRAARPGSNSHTDQVGLPCPLSGAAASPRSARTFPSLTVPVSRGLRGAARRANGRLVPPVAGRSPACGSPARASCPSGLASAGAAAWPRGRAQPPPHLLFSWCRFRPPHCPRSGATGGQPTGTLRSAGRTSPDVRLRGPSVRRSDG